MTVTDDFISVEEGQALDAAAPAYPSAFGIKFTPAVSSVLIAVLGLAGSIYLLLNQVMPTWQRYQELQASREEKQAQVEQKEIALKQSQKVKADLAQAKQRKAEVLTLFANEKTLDTLLLDVNRVIESANARIQGSAVRAKLKRFVPANQTAEVITDGSLGPEVNGKLKRRVVNVEFDAPTEQTQSILRNIERLQPLLIVKDYQSSLAQAAADSKGRAARRLATITTSFQLQALIPVSPEEAAKAAPPAPQK
jgi:type IV pilus assembly protein PilO